MGEWSGVYVDLLPVRGRGAGGGLWAEAEIETKPAQDQRLG